MCAGEGWERGDPGQPSSLLVFLLCRRRRGNVGYGHSLWIVGDGDVVRVSLCGALRLGVETWAVSAYVARFAAVKARAGAVGVRGLKGWRVSCWGLRRGVGQWVTDWEKRVVVSVSGAARQVAHVSVRDRVVRRIATPAASYGKRGPVVSGIRGDWAWRRLRESLVGLWLGRARRGCLGDDCSQLLRKVFKLMTEVGYLVGDRAFLLVGRIRELKGCNLATRLHCHVVEVTFDEVDLLGG